LAATSSNGAVRQKPSISATPVRILSVDGAGAGDVVFVIDSKGHTHSTGVPLPKNNRYRLKGSKEIIPTSVITATAIGSFKTIIQEIAASRERL